MAEQLKLALTEALDLSKALRPVNQALGGVIKALENAETAPFPEISRKVSALERAADRDPVRKAVPSLDGAVSEARERLGAISRERGDVLNRREHLDRLARDRGWAASHKERYDALGPFRLDHTEGSTAVRLGRLPLGKLKAPSAAEIVRFLEQARTKLETEATRNWDQFIESAYRRQQELSMSEPVRWKQLVQASIPDFNERRRKALIVLYRLAMLIFARAPGGWSFTCVPPTLGEQREAVEVPDFDHPGETVRVVRGRLLKP